MRSLPVLALLALTASLLAAPLAHAAVASEVASTDPDAGKPLVSLNAFLDYVDADGSGRPTANEPDEPVYLDADGSNSVSYGDLRLTGDQRYAAGTVVDLGNLDLGLPLSRSNGAWMQNSAHLWFIDLDGSGAVSVGDVRLSGDQFGHKVHPGDMGVGETLTPINPATFGTRLDYVDADHDGHHDALEALYIDAGGANGGGGTVTAGDLRLQATGFGLDNAPTRAEFDALQRQAGVDPSTGTPTTDSDKGDSGWHGPQVVLLILGLVNLVALAYVYTLAKQGTRPRNPFK